MVLSSIQQSHIYGATTCNFIFSGICWYSIFRTDTELGAFKQTIEMFHRHLGFLHKGILIGCSPAC